ncbi:MAG: hypothetical protein IPF66_21660 [Holophagales bacterium]|nr:hypothetical protein [Holophagales bacterium]
MAAFTFDTFMSQGSFGNLCDTDNFGDPVVLYDSFEDRWVISDFAFQLDGAGAVNPPVAYECIAVSKTGDPVTGGWNFYSLQMTDGLHDYPKMGIWPDGIYMSANMFTFAAESDLHGTPGLGAQQVPDVLRESDRPGRLVRRPRARLHLLPGNARLRPGRRPRGRPTTSSRAGSS